MSRLESILGSATVPKWIVQAGASILLGLTSCYSTAENVSMGMPLNKAKQIVESEGMFAFKYKLMLEEATARIEKNKEDYDAYFWKNLAEKNLRIRKPDAGFDAVFLDYLHKDRENPGAITELENSFKEPDIMNCIYACAKVRLGFLPVNPSRVAINYAHELLKDMIWQLDEKIKQGYKSPRDAYSDYHLRGQAKRFLNRFEEAIADFEAALKARPNDDYLNLKKDIEECKREIE